MTTTKTKKICTLKIFDVDPHYLLSWIPLIVICPPSLFLQSPYLSELSSSHVRLFKDSVRYVEVLHTHCATILNQYLDCSLRINYIILK